MTLNQASIGESVVIAAVKARGEVRKRLLDMGFVAGARVTILRRALLGDPIELRLGEYRIAIRAAEAESIEVAAG